MPGDRKPRAWLDTLLGACLLVLLAAVALTLAAHLLMAIWPVLAVAGGIVGTLSLLFAVLRAWYARSRYW